MEYAIRDTEYVIWNMCICRCNYLHTSYTFMIVICDYVRLCDYTSTLYMYDMWYEMQIQDVPPLLTESLHPCPLNLAGEGCVQNRIWIGGSMRCWEARVVKRSLFIKALELPVRGFLEAYRKICESQRVKFCEQILI